MTATRTQYTIFAALIVAIFVAATAVFHFKGEAEKDSITPPKWKANAEDINPSLGQAATAKAKPVEAENLPANNARAKLWAAYPWAMHRGVRSFDENTLLANLQTALVPPRMLADIQSKGLELDQIEVSMGIASRIFEFLPVPDTTMSKVLRSSESAEQNLAKLMLDVNKDGVVRFGEVKSAVRARFVDFDKNKDGIINEEDFVS